MPPTMNSSDLGPELLAHMKAIKAKAIEYGLDFFEVIYEKLDFDTMNQIASYGGFPVRYPHWRWGMEYDKLSKRDAYGLGRIYEMVINNDPCYAYLQESNSVTDQKLVMAHVYGHADFFKNNFWFSQTERKMMDQMANHATRVRRHIERQGSDAVERFLDACTAIEHLIDPHSAFMRRERGPEATKPFEPEKLPAKDYMDPFINPPAELERQKAAHAAKLEASKKAFPARPTRDVLLFLLRHARLEDWQADILGIIRDEAYYFAPQGMTKIMNEGWATYWHSKLMTEHFLEDREIIDYAEQHSGVVHMPPGGFNPYKIGVEILKDIERRWNRGQHGPEWERLEGIGEKEKFDDGSMKGREKIFEVRRIYNDVNFIDEYLTPEFVEKHQMYQFRRDPRTGEVKVVTRDFNRVKQTLLYRITNMGQPFVHVADGNYLNRGELYLAHEFSGLEVDASKAVDVLRGLRMIWGRPVHLQARVNDEMTLTTLESPDGDAKVQKITDEMPPPAHIIA
ncbi:MAG: SpoVR family protein [Phycisphaeraceae bacterium]|nr:MAG: SpoVR family protein [Phycisphaeraceae bacterium]